MLRSQFGALFSLSGVNGPLVGLLLLCAFLFFTTESFFSLRSVVNVLDQITVLGILSVASILSLCGMVMGYLAKEMG
ncbi:hypothetical protein [Marinomonas transparens]|uniref:Uncharacterized protein n=1 Tax=Marinomonas transparens TaxID=2795388 RepID=A0A934N709_9GAMM|nr:hypothetical protein [Marinomonas transparens]MBJ7538586.1 hypothetical protein [Marinomonas transparens]